MISLTVPRTGLVLVSGHPVSGKSTLLVESVEKTRQDRPLARVAFMSPEPVDLPEGVLWHRLPDDDVAAAVDEATGGRREVDILVVDEIVDDEHARQAILGADAGMLVLASVTADGPRAAIARVRELSQTPDGRFRRMLSDVLVISFSQLLMPGPGGLIPVREAVEIDDDLASTVRSGGHLGSAPRSTTRQEAR